MEVIVQARMSSSRLPGKALMKIGPKPVLWYVVSRLKRVRNISGIHVATTDEAGDDPLEKFCSEEGISVFRGSLTDVLDRFYQCAGKNKLRDIIRITADCPLLDPALIGEMASYYTKSKGNLDYYSNVNPPTYPDGLDVEIFSFRALEKAWKEAKLPSDREHVTPYIRNHPKLFRAENRVFTRDLSGLRWTLDEEADLKFISRVFEHFHYSIDFSMQDVLDLLNSRPELQALNASIGRNEGYKNSLAEDKKARMKK